MTVIQIDVGEVAKNEIAALQKKNNDLQKKIVALEKKLRTTEQSARKAGSQLAAIDSVREAIVSAARVLDDYFVSDSF